MFIRTLLGGAAMTLATVSAYAADIPGGPSTTVRLNLADWYQSTLASKNDVDWLRLKLAKGQTYALHGSWDCREAVVKLLDPQRRVVASVPWGWERGGATEVTAKVSGDHFVTVAPGRWNDEDCGDPTPEAQGGPLYPARYYLHARGDCAANTATTCALKLGARTKGAHDYANEHDWRRLEITTAGRYQVAIEGGWSDSTVALRDARGRLLLQATQEGDAPAVVTAQLARGRYFVDASSAYGEYQVDFWVTAAAAEAAQVATVRP